MFYRSEYCCPASPELDSRSKKGVVNKGERRRYLVENSHEPRAIEGCENASEFIPEIWHGTAERGVVMADGGIVREMMDGEKIRVKL